MASFIGGEFVRLMDAVMRTKPDISYRSAALGGETFAAVPGVDALGQNHFDLPISATAGGLRVYILARYRAGAGVGQLDLQHGFDSPVRS